MNCFLDPSKITLPWCSWILPLLSGWNTSVQHVFRKGCFLINKKTNYVRQNGIISAFFCSLWDAYPPKKFYGVFTLHIFAESKLCNDSCKWFGPGIQTTLCFVYLWWIVFHFSLFMSLGYELQTPCFSHCTFYWFIWFPGRPSLYWQTFGHCNQLILDKST